MARSIHETRRGLVEEWRSEFSDASKKAENLWIIADRLRRKRRYKRRSARPASAHRAVPEDAGWAVEVIRHDQQPGVFHPLSAADIGGLLAAFPADVRPELASIHLRLGRREDDMRLGRAEPDPITGRPGHQEGPVWTPALRGRWRRHPAEIDLFGYVYDPQEIVVPELLEPILWLLQAKTLAHEVAHAWDATGRRARDRWALDERARGEEHAEAQAHDWLVSVAVPYYRQHHPDAAAAFSSWVETHLGAPGPLERFAQDTDTWIWGTSRAALRLAGGWSADRPNDHRAEFAVQLHYVEDFITARAVLASVLAADPDHQKSVILMGDIAVHEADWPAALEWTARARQLFPDSADARIHRIDALLGSQSRDEALAEIAAGLASVPAEERWFHCRARQSRALLAASQGPDDLLAADLAWLRGLGTNLDGAAADAIEAEWQLRRGRADDARRIARQALAAPYKPPGIWGAMIRAVAWETAADNGSRDRVTPSQRDIEILIGGGRQDWAGRLRAAGLVPRTGASRRQADLRRRPRAS